MEMNIPLKMENRSVSFMKYPDDVRLKKYKKFRK